MVVTTPVSANPRWMTTSRNFTRFAQLYFAASSLGPWTPVQPIPVLPVSIPASQIPHQQSFSPASPPPASPSAAAAAGSLSAREYGTRLHRYRRTPPPTHLPVPAVRPPETRGSLQS